MSKILSYDDLKDIKVKQVKAWDVPKDAEYVGVLWRPYGDENYYKCSDGTYVYTYTSIGD